MSTSIIYQCRLFHHFQFYFKFWHLTASTLFSKLKHQLQTLLNKSAYSVQYQFFSIISFSTFLILYIHKCKLHQTCLEKVIRIFANNWAFFRKAKIKCLAMYFQCSIYDDTTPLCSHFHFYLFHLPFSFKLLGLISIY